MSRDKATRTAPKSRGLGWLLHGHGPLVFTFGVIAAVLTFGTLWVWQAIRPRVLDAPQYRLNARDIVISPAPPQWISADDLRAEVMRDASLDQQLSIIDDKLAERIAIAFAAHPWVARVDRVEKFHPARVVVTLVYRKPVASVATGTELWPIDRSAILLPHENFSLTELSKLPQVTGIPNRPTVRPGNLWQDIRVQGAALVAEALADCWQQMELAEITMAAPPAGAPQSAFGYDLITRGGKHIAWGRQPIVDDPSEPTAAEKLKRLKSFVEQHGSLDSVSQGGTESDVQRTARALEAAGAK
ncbi:MAG: hypothetical protein K8T25_06015 [Planctomycetia bacterium]|nr:hypothetical protein [Planctomycetia bacterium]